MLEHSEVLFVEFAGCQGRVLVDWATEGPGELTWRPGARG